MQLLVWTIQKLAEGPEVPFRTGLQRTEMDLRQS